MTPKGPLRTAVIIGSTREGRVGESIGRWFAARAELRDDLAVSVLDLADYAFPCCFPAVATPAMRAFSRAVAGAEAFAVVTPEYNRSFPASLKQAIDFAYDEWQAKPVGFVSYGSGSDGFYAIEQLRTVFAGLHTVTVRDGVGIDLLGGGVDDGGTPYDTDERSLAVTTMLDQLLWWGLALRAARATRPFAS
ncbi:NADPH-dependent FMN reductase [Nonomuraea dietziae]|uniref:NAD(P)H-dependent FMN reductase n=1 Tax=Nonomuraea dietziae TaxID=65515 RepID=A0A7W5YMM2_9ACTN|nr:NAD(P)H-dependent oxidoreductase [Nonomuraea dietziae]MBB3726487.1 NAD(P)H-dependent FMN reductase [Nonomuraea dietziae]